MVCEILLFSWKMDSKSKQSSERKIWKKKNVQLSLYRSKRIAKGKQLALDLKRKSSCKNVISPIKLPKIEESKLKIHAKGPDDNNYSQGDIRQHDLHIKVEPVNVKRDNLCNPVPLESDNNSGTANNTHSVKDNACAILTDRALLDPLIDVLYDNDLLNHYLAHFQEISSSRLSPMNLAVLFGLERAYWQTLNSTTNMVYKEVTKNGTLFVNDCMVVLT